MDGLLWLLQHLGPRFELNEIGASADINTMIERYPFELGGVTVGPQTPTMLISPNGAALRRSPARSCRSKDAIWRQCTSQTRQRHCG